MLCVTGRSRVDNLLAAESYPLVVRLLVESPLVESPLVA
jgi:hypothetical protein